MDWNQIKSEYIAGGTSYRKLADKYKNDGVTLSALRRIAIKEDWVGLREQAVIETNTKMIEDVSTQNAVHTQKIIAVADKLLDKISESLDNLPALSPQSIKNFTSALKDLKEIKGIKSDADMREQEARIKKLMKDAEEGISTDSEAYTGVLLLPPIMEMSMPTEEDADGT